MKYGGILLGALFLLAPVVAVPAEDVPHGHQLPDKPSKKLNPDAQWESLEVYANPRGEALILDYRFYEEGPCTEPIKKLLASISWKLAERGFKYVRHGTMNRPVIKIYELTIGADVEYNQKTDTFCRKNGNLEVIMGLEGQYTAMELTIFHDNGESIADKAKANVSGMAFAGMEELADGIMAALNLPYAR